MPEEEEEEGKQNNMSCDVGEEGKGSRRRRREEGLPPPPPPPPPALDTPKPTLILQQRREEQQQGCVVTPVKQQQKQQQQTQWQCSKGANAQWQRMNSKRAEKKIEEEGLGLVASVGKRMMDGKKKKKKKKKGGGDGEAAVVLMEVPDTPRCIPDCEAAQSEGSSGDTIGEEDAVDVVGVGNESSGCDEEHSREKSRTKGAAKKQRNRRNKKAKKQRELEGWNEKDGRDVAVDEQGGDAAVDEERKEDTEGADSLGDGQQHAEDTSTVDALSVPNPIAVTFAQAIGHASIGETFKRENHAMAGPYVIDSLSKEGSKKKEDKWLLKPNNTWEIGNQPRKVNFSAWGIFDGHGGRQVATFASHALLKYVVDGCSTPAPEAVPLSGSVPEGLAHFGPEDQMDWMLQNELVRRLPQAIQKSFLECDEEACKRFPHGGTTATMAILCGWQLLVANVGDSCAYLDTGSEVLAVSGNHRLDDNKDEIQRIEENGGEVAPSSIDGKPAGPARVWPGGLAMSRTIGDKDSGQLTRANAEVSQVTIPRDGARLIIGSDGLWDAVHPKTAAHHTREMTASEASHKLLAMAIKKDNLKDDVTVIVVDFCPSTGDKLPPGLALHKPCGKKGKCAVEKLAIVRDPVAHYEIDWVMEEYQRRLDVSEEICVRLEEERLVKERRRELQQEEESKQAVQQTKSLYDELASLKISPEDLQDNDADDWETIQTGKGLKQENTAQNPKSKKSRQWRSKKLRKPDASKSNFDNDADSQNPETAPNLKESKKGDKPKNRQFKRGYRRINQAQQDLNSTEHQKDKTSSESKSNETEKKKMARYRPRTNRNANSVQ